MIINLKLFPVSLDPHFFLAATNLWVLFVIDIDYSSINYITREAHLFKNKRKNLICFGPLQRQKNFSGTFMEHENNTSA